MLSHLFSDDGCCFLAIKYEKWTRIFVVCIWEWWFVLELNSQMSTSFYRLFFGICVRVLSFTYRFFFGTPRLDFVCVSPTRISVCNLQPLKTMRTILKKRAYTHKRVSNPIFVETQELKTEHQAESKKKRSSSISTTLPQRLKTITVCKAFTSSVWIALFILSSRPTWYHIRKECNRKDNMERKKRQQSATATKWQRHIVNSIWSRHRTVACFKIRTPLLNVI